MVKLFLAPNDQISIVNSLTVYGLAGVFIKTLTTGSVQRIIPQDSQMN